MSTPFTGSIIGSWLFTRSSHPAFPPRIIHHYTAEGKYYCEMDQPDYGRVLVPIKYRLVGSIFTIIYSTSTEREFELTLEDDGSVRVPSPQGSPNDTEWWMVRLTKPESYSIAFVDERGQLQRFKNAAL